jgi:pentatricopeptide repeat protein
MLRSGCHPNEHTFKMLVSTFCKNEDFDEAIQVLKEMLDRSMAPDSGSLSEICSGLCQRGKIQEAKMLCSEMVARGVTPHPNDTQYCLLLAPPN